jgi:mannose/cellobiose epimerase-like protein (N-acyl-D-glucosamine 2-epimerase family)
MQIPVGATKESFVFNEVQASIAYAIVSQNRNHGNYTLGVLLTAVEAALGDSKQSEALKAIVRREMFALMDRNQGEIYESVDMQRPGLYPKETRVDGQDGNDLPN